MTARYVVVPGYIRSRTDGDEHYVTGPQLAWLYGLRPGEYEVYKPNADPDKYAGTYVCTPRLDGKYPIFEGAANAR
jgi:hypothetical protein